jgi:hypothetical protein
MGADGRSQLTDLTGMPVIVLVATGNECTAGKTATLLKVFYKAQVGFVYKYLHRRVPCGMRLQYTHGVIGTSIVYCNDFNIWIGLEEQGFKLLFQEFFAIVRSQYNRYQWKCYIFIHDIKINTKYVIFIDEK